MVDGSNHFIAPPRSYRRLATSDQRLAFRIFEDPTGDTRMKRLLLSLTAALSLVACSSATTGSGASNPSEKANTITAEEIAKARAPGWYAYELINNLRPAFLKARNAVTLESRDPIYADVYVDEVYLGDVDALKSLPLEGIKNISFLNPFDAATRFAKE